MEAGNSNHAVVEVLLSGGIDSTACLAFYQEQGFSVQSTFIEYGQLASQRESKAARAIADHFGVRLMHLKWTGGSPKDSGLINGRNAFILIGALMETTEKVSTLGIGIHSGTHYLDCGPHFIMRMQSVFDIYTGGRVQIGTPFLRWTKNDIWAYCISKKVPLELTYSCELGLDQPCGKCLSCHDLDVLNAIS